jgi:hypothetical protein
MSAGCGTRVQLRSAPVVWSRALTSPYSQEQGADDGDDEGAQPAGGQLFWREAPAGHDGRHCVIVHVVWFHCGTKTWP